MTNEQTAARIIADLEILRITQGEHRGDPMVVLPWQEEIIEAMTKYRDIGFSIARSNGKTTLIAGLACSAIRPDGHLFIPRGEIVIVASSLGQAGICFRHIRHFLAPWIHDKNGKLIREKWKVADNHHEKSIEYKPTGTLLKTIGSDPKRAHGLAPNFAIMDEPAQWIGGGEEMYNAITTGMGKQENPRVFAIGTQSDNPAHFFQRMLRSKSPTTWTKVYSADPGDEDFNVESIKKANPSYGHIKALRDDIDSAIGKVKAGSLKLGAYRAYYLNMGVPESDLKEPLIPVSNWEQVVKTNPAPREGPVAIGIDLGGGTSMSAIAFYWPLSGRLETYAAYPENPPLLERGKADGVDDLYQKMFDRGEIILIGDYATDNVEFLKRSFSLVDEYERIGITADTYDKLNLMQSMFELGFDAEKVIDTRRVGKGAHGKEDVEAFQSEILDGHLSVAPNLCLDYGISKSMVQRDSNGNPAVDKRHDKGRIDVVQAAILAVGMGQRWRKPSEFSGLAEMHGKLLESGELVKGM